MESIEEYMLNDHKELDAMMDSINSGIEAEIDIDERLKKLFFRLEEHFLVEEKVVFMELHDKHNEYPIVSSLLVDHKDISALLKKMIDNKKERTLDNVSKLMHLLRRHRQKEERLLYPKLDENLDNKTKQLIFKKLAQGG